MHTKLLLLLLLLLLMVVVVKVGGSSSSGRCGCGSRRRVHERHLSGVMMVMWVMRMMMRMSGRCTSASQLRHEALEEVRRRSVHAGQDVVGLLHKYGHLAAYGRVARAAFVLHS